MARYLVAPMSLIKIAELFLWNPYNLNADVILAISLTL